MAGVIRDLEPHKLDGVWANKYFNQMVAGSQTVAATSSHCSLTPQPVAEARWVELSHYNLSSCNDETKKPGRYPSARPYRENIHHQPT